MHSGATNAEREGLPSYMRPRIAPLVSPNVTKNGHEPNASLFLLIVSRRLVSFSANPSRNRTRLSSRRPDVLNALQLAVVARTN